jgi:hypothetical protein
LVEEGPVMNDVAFQYSIRTHPARIAGGPESIGDRLVGTLDALSASDPSVFADWEITELPTKSSVPLATTRSRIGAMIRKNVVRDQLGEPDPDHGYNAMAFTDVADMSRLIHLWINAGGKYDGLAWLQTGTPRFPVDLSIVTFPIFKAALLALVANWTLPWTCAYAFRSNYAMMPVHGGAGYKLESRPMLPQEPTFPHSPFHIPWIGYLSAALSSAVRLSPEIATERTGDGGLLMIATDERLDPANPEHLRRARLIAETLIACTDWRPGGNDQH